MRDGYHESPFNQISPVVWLVLLPMLAMEIVLNAGNLGLAGGPEGAGWRIAAIEKFALSPKMLGYMAGSGDWRPDYLMRFVTYGFVHYSLTHALMAGVFVLALGKMVSDVFRPWAFLVIFFGAELGGALIYSLIPGVEAPLLGAYPPAYGLIGAFTFVLWARLGALNANRAGAFTMIGGLMAIQLVFAVLFGGNPVWFADVGGFATGFGLSFLVAPGGPARMLALLRRR